MKRNTPESIVKRYLFQRYSILFATAAILAAVYILSINYFIDYYVALSVIALAFVFYYTLEKRSFNKNIASILTDELDAEKCMKVCFSRGVPIFYSLRLSSSFLAGDYQTAANICYAILKANLSPSVKCTYAANLAGIYFEMGNYQKLTEACDTFDSNFVKCKKARRKKLAEIYGWQMDFLKHFTGGELERCADMCAEREEKHLLDPVKNKLPLTAVYLDCVVVYYKLGNTEKCRRYCEKLTKEAPRLYRASIAEKYLEALDTGNDEPLNHVEIFHDQNAHTIISKTLLRSRIIRIICSIALIPVCVYLIIYTVNHFRFEKYKSEKIEVAREKYADAQSISFVHFPLDDENVWLIYAITNADGSVDIVAPYIVNGESIFLPLAENVPLGEVKLYEHSPESKPGEYFEYAIVDKHSDVPDDTIDQAKIKINGKTKYFYIRSS